MDITLALQAFGIVFLILMLIGTINYWAPVLFVAVIFVFTYATLAVINEDMDRASERHRKATQMEVQKTKQRQGIFEQGRHTNPQFQDQVLPIPSR